MKKMKRVVATGMSCITPIGRTVQENWKNILAGKSALKFLEDQKGHCKIGGRLPEEYFYDFPESPLKTRIHNLSNALVVDLIEDADIDFLSQAEEDKWRSGVLISN